MGNPMQLTGILSPRSKSALAKTPRLSASGNRWPTMRCPAQAAIAQSQLMALQAKQGAFMESLGLYHTLVAGGAR